MSSATDLAMMMAMQRTGLSPEEPKDEAVSSPFNKLPGEIKLKIFKLVLGRKNTVSRTMAHQKFRMSGLLPSPCCLRNGKALPLEMQDRDYCFCYGTIKLKERPCDLCQSNLEYPCRQCSQVDISLFLVNKDTAMWARDAFFDANTIRIEALKQRAGSLEHCEQEMRSVELAFGVAAKMMLEIDTDDTELVRYKSLPRLRRLRLVVMEHTFDIVGKGREMGRADILAWMAEIGLFGMKAKKA